MFGSLFGRPRLPRRRQFRLLPTLVVTMAIVSGLVSPVPATNLFSVKAATASPGSPNLFDPTTRATSINHLPPQPTANVVPSPPGPPQMRNTSAFSMVPANVTLTSGLATDFVSSDGRFEVSIPKAAVSDADVTAAGGTMTLSIRQVDPESGSNAGGSGHYSFGRYLIQVLNSSGQTTAQGLRQPVTLILHYGRASGVDLVHSYVQRRGLGPLIRPSKCTPARGLAGC